MAAGVEFPFAAVPGFFPATGFAPAAASAKPRAYPKPFGEADYGMGAVPKPLLEQRLTALSASIRCA